MRLSKKIVQIMEQQGIDLHAISHRTGLYKRSIQWIFDNGSVSEEAAERIANALGVSVGEILISDPSGDDENVIEFTKDQKRATVTFCQGRYKTQIERLAKKFPDECQIVERNADGSMMAHVPTEWVKIFPNRTVGEKQRELSRQRMLAFHSERGSHVDETT